MIEVVLEIILILFVLFTIVLPICIRLSQEQIWIFIQDKLKEQEKHEQLRRNMKQRKKGNQGKTLLE